MQTERSIGIDYLRAFFSVCVVLVHLGYISPSMIFNKVYYNEHVFSASDFINFYVLLLAVPVFFIISNYLFLKKPKDKSSLFIYLKRIGKLAVFWIILYVMFRYRGWDIINWVPKSPAKIVIFIMSGGYTIYFFFISLLGLTITIHFSKFLNIFYVTVLFIITTLIVSVLPLVSIVTDNFILSVFWNPLNFLPYPFAAILVSHIARLDRVQIKPLYIILTGALVLLLAIADWTIYVNKGFFQVNIYAIPAYARPSLVLIAMVVLFISIKVNPKRNPIIMFMSRNSLALYCLHPFFIWPATKLSGDNLFIRLIIVLTLSYIAAIVMKQVMHQELIISN